MKRAVSQVALLAGVLFLVCVVCRLTMRNTYVDRIPVAQGQRMDQSVRLVTQDGHREDVLNPGVPMAAARGSSISATDLAPAANITSSTARISTSVTP